MCTRSAQYVLLLVVVVGVAAARAPPAINKNPTDDDGDVQVLKYENYIKEVDNNKRNSKQEQEGELKNKGLEDDAYTVRGSFMWISPEGIRYEVNYVVEQNEYQPEFDEAPGAPSPALMAALAGG